MTSVQWPWKHFALWALMLRRSWCKWSVWLTRQLNPKKTRSYFNTCPLPSKTCHAAAWHTCSRWDFINIKGPLQWKILLMQFEQMEYVDFRCAIHLFTLNGDYVQKLHFNQLNYGSFYLSIPLYTKPEVAHGCVNCSRQPNMQNTMFHLTETLKTVNCSTIKCQIRWKNIIYVHNKQINKQ